MIKFLHKLFNYHKIDELERIMETYRSRNQQLEEELREYKGYKLKYQLAELYINDDEALLEIFEASEEKAEEKDGREAARLQRLHYGAQGQIAGASGLLGQQAASMNYLY